jgi:hypothetical protein
MTYNRTLFVVIVAPLTVVVGAGTAAGQSAPDCSTVSYSGDGTETNPYEVGNVDQLQCINETDLTANYIQTSDIDASETVAWNNGKGFEPIGGPSRLGAISGGPGFNGSFDGNGQTISNLTITRSSRRDAGLFGLTLDGSSITNVRLKNIDIVGGSPTGALVGENSGTVTKSSVSGTVAGEESSASYTGGLVGINEGTISKSFSTATITGGRTTGGLVGGNGGGDIFDSYARGEISAADPVGGLVGSGGDISRSYAATEITLIGLSYQKDGLIGSGGEVTDSYWDVPTSGTDVSEGGTGLGNLSDTPPAGEMTGKEAADNMEGFDFRFTWSTVTNPDGYPVLQWQTEEESNPANFEVTIQSTNSPVTEGENLTVTAKITNTGGNQDTQTVTGETIGLSPPVEIPTTLDPGESTTETRSARTFPGDAGTYTVEVTSEDDTATTTVEVLGDDSEQHPSGVSQSVFDAVAGQNGDTGEVERGDVVDSIDAFFSNQELAGESLTRSDVVNIIDWFFSN